MYIFPWIIIYLKILIKSSNDISDKNEELNISQKKYTTFLYFAYMYM